MKKLVLMFAAVAAISFASCENAQKPAEAAADSAAVDTAAVDTAAADTAAADTAAADTAAAE